MRIAGLVTCLLILTLGFLLSPARAEDPPASGDPGSDELATRLIDVGALVLGLRDFIPEATGDLVGPDAVSDENHPLFGAEAEEALLPVGTIDEVLERIRGEVAPDSWGAISGATLRALGDTIVLRSRPDVVASAARLVGTLEGQFLVPVAVEVRAVRLAPGEPPAATLDAAAARDLFTRPSAGPAVSVLGTAGQRSSAFGGKQVAHVADYDVMVAEKSSILDPIVDVQNFGLSLSVRPLPSPDRKRVLLGLLVRLSRLIDLQSVPSSHGSAIESPHAEVARIRAVVDAPVGLWQRIDGASVVGGQEGWAFYVRARVGAAAAEASATSGTPIAGLDVKSTGTFDVRSIDVGVLAQLVGNTMGETGNLVPSNFTPPELPELPEPEAAVSPEGVADLIREMVAPSVWERGGSIDLQRAWLRIRAPQAALDAVERLVTSCRRHFLWAVEVTGETVEVPESLALDLLDGAAEGRFLSPQARALLDAALRDGRSTLKDRVVVSSLHGARNAVVAGTRRAYLADYQVEIANDSRMANPVVQTAHSGFVLDVRPALFSTDAAVLVEVRASSQFLEEPLRRAPTPHGEITVPTLALSRIRTTAMLPLDRTAVLGSTGEAGRRTLFLLTARRTRSE